MGDSDSGALGKAGREYSKAAATGNRVGMQAPTWRSVCAVGKREKANGWAAGGA